MRSPGMDNRLEYRADQNLPELGIITLGHSFRVHCVSQTKYQSNKNKGSLPAGVPWGRPSPSTHRSFVRYLCRRQDISPEKTLPRTLCSVLQPTQSALPNNLYLHWPLRDGGVGLWSCQEGRLHLGIRHPPDPQLPGPYSDLDHHKGHCHSSCPLNRLFVLTHPKTIRWGARPSGRTRKLLSWLHFCFEEGAACYLDAGEMETNTNLCVCWAIPFEVLILTLLLLSGQLASCGHQVWTIDLNVGRIRTCLGWVSAFLL